MPGTCVSRAKATFAGAIAGMTVAIGALMAFLTVAAGSTAHFVNHGLTGLHFVFVALPGCLLIGALFAFPTSAAMVFSTTALARKLPWLDNAWAWAAAGTLFTAPTAYLFSNLQNTSEQFALVSIWSFGLVVGAISGLSAWIFRLSPIR